MASDTVVYGFNNATTEFGFRELAIRTRLRIRETDSPPRLPPKKLSRH